MNLREAGVGEQRAAFVRPPDGGGVGSLGVGGEIEDVAVAAGAEHHRVAEVGLDLPGHQVAGDDAARAAVHHDQVEHLGAREHRHLPGAHLPFQRLVGAQQQLLPGLAARVEGARYLRAAEAAVVQVARVFAGERHALRHALVDDVHRNLRQPVDVGFARAEIAALDRVVEQAVDAVAVVVVVLGGVDAALRGDRVRAPRRILEAEALDVVAQLAQAGRGAAAGQSRPHHEDGVFPLIRRIHQLEMEAMPLPPRFDRSVRRFRNQFHLARLFHLVTRPAITASGMEQLPIAIRMAKIAAPFFSFGV